MPNQYESLRNEPFLPNKYNIRTDEEAKKSSGEIAKIAEIEHWTVERSNAENWSVHYFEANSKKIGNPPKITHPA